jgi:predicted lipid-binding transport protein (Tim44 family)
MSKWILGLCAVALGAFLFVTDADAKRLGGGRSVGTQRSVTPPPAAVPARPAQQPQQAAPAAQGGSKWAGILGGLALGGLLGYLLGSNGMLGGMIGMLLLAALAIGGVLLVRAFMQRRSAEAPRPMQLAGMGNETFAAPPSQPAGMSAQSAPAATQAANVPPGFDAAGFLRAAKLNFVKLQVANDAGQLEEIREFTTGEMFDALRKDALARPSEPQQTDVVSLNADLLEVASEKDRHWASVRFSGMVRETPGTAPVGFEEVWNLVKPADGSSGWLLAGIQQMH